MEELPQWKAIQTAGIEPQYRAKIKEKHVKWHLWLTESNMRKLYEQSSWGWDKKHKMSELTDTATRIITLYTKNKIPIGFISYQLTNEDYPTLNTPTIYCYEVQIVPEWQGKGVGGMLMGLLEEIGRLEGAGQSMLSVFEHNQRALDFYTRRLNYTPLPIEEDDDQDVVELVKQLP